ncbi:MAG: hypothetical protein IPI00_10735 [Flavobacteriales bacterium]|nr:hypothetical protein [Flavobacteriales bacterium]MBK6943477.1 hypothetical protein [Flavobacteriales bacterium]MBK7240635.1 hypothetical protein [Flavobacteriales bacterium]MBK7297322.1 hypothetical protein [Flavobacteriales bacterium]MBK9535986.1 hypothetical protein [Flavobacteriales bacterium]
MKTLQFKLCILPLLISACINSDVHNSIKDVQLELVDTIQTRATIPYDSISVTEIDTLESIQTKTANKKLIDEAKEWKGTHDVKLALNEFKVTDSSFYSLLDSIVRTEKLCSNSSLDDLHWILFKWKHNVYYLTMASDGGGYDYSGFFVIDDMLFLTTESLPGKLTLTDNIEKFTFEGKNYPYPEDYSTYFLANMNGQMKLVKSYTLPCH